MSADLVKAMREAGERKYRSAADWISLVKLYPEFKAAILPHFKGKNGNAQQMGRVLLSLVGEKSGDLEIRARHDSHAHAWRFCVRTEAEIRKRVIAPPEPPRVAIPLPPPRAMVSISELVHRPKPPAPPRPVVKLSTESAPPGAYGPYGIRPAEPTPAPPRQETPMAPAETPRELAHRINRAHLSEGVGYSLPGLSHSNGTRFKRGEYDHTTCRIRSYLGW
jgi:hypothetical protein